jgi:hypothetical protein
LSVSAVPGSLNEGFMKKIECVFPTRRDVRDVLIRSFGRHPGGPRGWWRNYAAKLGPEKVVEVVISTWEAGRAKAAKIGR